MKNYTVSFGSGDPRGFTGLSPTFLLFYNLASGTTNTPPSIAETISGKTGIYTFSYGVTQPISFLIDAATTSPGTSGRYVVGQIDPADRADEYGNSLMAIGSTLFGIGTSNIALGTTNVALGVTNVALGTSNLALGFSNLALGTTNLAIGTTIYAGLQGLGVSFGAFGTTTTANFLNLGLTLVGGFNTAIALGQSSALFSVIGSTASSYGSTSVDPTTVMGFLIRAQEFREGNQTYTKNTGLLDYYSRGSSTLLREKTVSDTTTQTTKT